MTKIQVDQSTARKLLIIALVVAIGGLLLLWGAYVLIGLAFGFESISFAIISTTNDHYRAKRAEVVAAIEDVARYRGYGLLNRPPDDENELDYTLDLVGKGGRARELRMSINIIGTVESAAPGVNRPASMQIQVYGFFGDGSMRGWVQYFLRIPRNSIREDTDSVARAIRSVLGRD